MREMIRAALVAVPIVPLAFSAAVAADPALKCESSKLKAASKYASCRLKASAKAVLKQDAPDFQRCDDKFGAAWDKAEDRAGAGICPSEGDRPVLQGRIAGDTTSVAVSVSPVRFFDTGFGTVLDHRTGLEWQKSDDAGGLTDKDNAYTWTTVPFGQVPDGTAFTVFLYGLNSPDGPGAAAPEGPTDTGCFAGRCDWRIPTIEELRTIIDCSFGDPCIDQAVFGPTMVSGGYWSSSTVDGTPFFAWAVPLDDGSNATGTKDLAVQVRAVRRAF